MPHEHRGGHAERHGGQKQNGFHPQPRGQPRKGVDPAEGQGGRDDVQDHIAGLPQEGRAERGPGDLEQVRGPRLDPAPAGEAVACEQPVAHEQEQHERGPDGDRDERGVGEPRCTVGREPPPAEPEGQIAEDVEQAGRAGHVQRDEHHLGGTEHGRADGEGVLSGDAPNRRRQEHDRHGHDALRRLDEAQERFPPHRGRHRNG